jgi:P22 coat protein - gene protein 5
MAGNTFLTPQLIARESLAVLRANLIFGGLVYRDYDPEFAGQVGDTITIRKPGTFTAKVFDRTTGIEIQDYGETSTSVTLDTLLDVSFVVTTEDLTLRLTDFRERLIEPAMRALAEGIETKLLGLRTDVTQTVDADDPDHPSKALVDAGKILNDAKAPMAGRTAVLTTGLAATFQKDPLFHEAHVVGDNGTALREASLGRKFGFDVVSSNYIGSGDSVAFSRDAFALITRTLALPQGIGAGQGSIVNYEGYALRVVQSYDQKFKQDVISVDCLVGAKTLRPEHAVKITYTP